MPKHPSGISLEVSLPRRNRRFETGIDNPIDEEEEEQTGQTDELGPGTKSFGSPRGTKSFGSASRASARRFAPYPAQRPLTPEVAAAASPGLASSMTELLLEGPVSARTRAASAGFKRASSEPQASFKRGHPRVPRHLDALAKASEINNNTARHGKVVSPTRLTPPASTIRARK